MTDEAWQIVFFTIKIAALSTLLILPFGIGIAWLMARRDWSGKAIAETLVMLPLFVPPVATGLVLLTLFGRYGALGSFFSERSGGRLSSPGARSCWQARSCLSRSWRGRRKALFKK